MEMIELNAQKERVFLLVNKDLRLEYVSRTNSLEPRNGDKEEFQVGTFLPDFLPLGERADFVAQLRKGFDGISFSFEAFFPFDFQYFGECLITLTPAHFENGKVKAVSVSVECHDSFRDDLARFGAPGLAGQVYNSIAVGICVLDRNGRYIEVNQSFCRIIESTRSQLIGRHIGFSLKVDLGAKVEDLLTKFTAEQELPGDEVDITLPSGKNVILSVKSNLVSSSGKDHLIVAVQDVTKLRRLQFQLGTITSKVPGIVIRYVLYPDGSDRVLYVSPGVEQLYGYDINSILSDASLIWNSVDSEYLGQLRDIVQKSGNELADWNYTYKYNHPDGKTRWLKGAGTPTAGADGSITWESFILDVTEETEAKLEFAKKERLFNSLINDGVEMMALLDVEGRYVYTSPSFLHKLGYETEELKGLNAFNQIHPDHVDQVKQDFVGLMTSRKASTKPYLKRKKDGSYIWLQTTGTNLLDDPLINGIVINSVEVTDLILAERDVKASEMQYKYLFENNPRAMLLWDIQNGLILDANLKCVEMYGYSREELLKKNIHDLRWPEDLAWMVSLQNKGTSSLKEGDAFYVGESIHVKKNGEIMHVEIDSRIIKYQGKLVSLVLTHDITEQKRIQNEIKQSEAKYRTIFDMSPMPKYIFRLSDLRIMDVNERAQLHYGYSREEFMAMTVLDLRPTSEVEKFMDSYRDVVDNAGSQNRGIFIHKTKNGKLIQSEITSRRIQFQDSECMMVVVKDVTKKILQEKLDRLEQQMMEQTIQEGYSLEERLEKYLKGIEELLPETKAAIVKVKEGVVTTLASPGLPSEFVKTASEFRFNQMPDLGSEPLFLEGEGLEERYAGDPSWEKIKHTGNTENVRSCFFQPILDEEQLVGAFEVYFSSFRKPEQWMADHFYRIGSRIGLILENHLKTRELKLSNERYNYVNLATRDALYDYDIVQERLYWGESYQRLVGCVPQGVSASLSDWRELIHPKDRSRVIEQLDKTIADSSQPLFQVDYQIRRADQSYAHVTDRGFIVRDKQGKAIRVVGVLADISERKEFEASLKQLNETLENRNKELALSNAELEQFAYVTSHDLQEPLRMITGFMNQLELKYKDQLDEKARRYIYFAVDGANRMRQIILDLLEFSRIGRSEEEKKDVPLDEIIAEVKTLNRDYLASGIAQITFSSLPVIKASPTPLLQIFQNLIGNGIKFSREGVPPRVDISVQDRGEFWEFEVKDNGIGIDENNYERIFMIFQRLNGHDKYTGNGIGLAIVKKALDQLGGEIWLKSTVNEGSIFYFTLPK